MGDTDRPLLVYDGDCGICTTWVRYWAGLTGDRVRYAPYQEVAHTFPEVSEEEFRRAIQFFDAAGQRAGSGALATFLVLARAPRKGAWLWCYRHLPLFAPVAEWTYGYTAHHRGALARATHWLWGRELTPEHYRAVYWLFLRCLGLIYLAAFVSMAVQVRGLAGEAGILPLADYLARALAALGNGAYWRLPTLFWIESGDAALVGVCLAGAACALLVTCNRLLLPALAGAYLLYLSLFYAGQEFTSFQWDLLLLETGFLAMLLPSRSRIALWLFRYLAFRFVFLAGAAKILSGDPTWTSLAALDYHYETQPLPSFLAWYAHHLPGWVHRASVAATLVIELVVPFLFFAPRRPRMLAAWSVLVFQLLILLTGSYNFFNLLAMALCLFLFDDLALGRLAPRRLRKWPERPPSRTGTVLAAGCAALILTLSGGQLWRYFGGDPPAALSAALYHLAPLRVTSTYGLFANMTTRRPEIVVEGSDDGRTWRAYEFRYKPGDPYRRPLWCTPHQPRLDWQMWFAALGTARQNPWFLRFTVALLRGSEPVLALLAEDPFAGSPPREVRARLYDYRFSTPEERARDGRWWSRRPIGMYLSPIALPAER